MDQSFETKIVHHSLKKTNHIRSKTTPIFQTSAFTFSSLEELEGFYQGDESYLYSRTGNPNTDELGQMVANLEGAPSGVATSSGLSAILAGLLSVVSSGVHIVAAEDIYGGTHHLLKEELKNLGIETSFVNFADQTAIRDAILENTKLLYSETVTNPFLRVEQIDTLVKLGKDYNLYTMVDNTFATPYLLNPYQEGIDIVAHSATKYLGGHSDVTAGVVVGSEELMTKARQKVVNLGSNLSSFEAWLTCRGIKTLALRMERQSANAKQLADALYQNSNIKKVYYPTDLSSKGNGAIVTIELADTCDIHRFFSSLGWVKIVPTLAGVETTVSYPLGTSHRALSLEEQQNIGINQQVVRISIGIEDAEDIIKQFDEAIHASI
ncbi:trans-sulfuration enzyme family protein [Heyndrickxia sporothermodurans]|uniref:trans-sulfuration enzyme family protein n=1 Tax=Heyndrickxia sporothermodurans TaxID=46224 RepID=UPI00192B53B2|nr:aminotransferase class I/II-fold pyridoxal phosphate-dependent enzyme [Heyndrickxia sporothermodurans]MBL5804956.1 aminotransferase class I/II-fold pyridoxal phosphate-dependent enzyme [Heyndrickxia sporothermodurans]